MKLNFNNWQKIKINEIFKNNSIRKYSKIPTTVGNIPFISCQTSLNGIANYCNLPFIAGDCITVSTNGHCFDCFYQPNPIAVSTDVEVLYPNDTFKKYFNRYTALFLVTVMNLNQEKYNFGIKPKNNKVWQTEILLPFKNNNPDWEYMENYIKGIYIYQIQNFVKQQLNQIKGQ